jgi:magnesium-transporting ATPase (P-type)
MSVVVEAPDGSMALHTKGADSVILPRLTASPAAPAAAADASQQGMPRQEKERGEEEQEEGEGGALQLAAAEESLHHFASQVSKDRSPRRVLRCTGSPRWRGLSHETTRPGSVLIMQTVDALVHSVDSNLSYLLYGSLMTARHRTAPQKHTQGLRTLVLAARPLPDRAWYEEWDARYQAAAAAVHADPRVRAGELDALADEMERELRLVGVAAIEDQLQV